MHYSAVEATGNIINIIITISYRLISIYMKNTYTLREWHHNTECHVGSSGSPCGKREEWCTCDRCCATNKHRTRIDVHYLQKMVLLEWDATYFLRY